VQQNFNDIQSENATLKQQLDKALQQMKETEQTLRNLTSERNHTLREKDDMDEKFKQLTLTSRHKEETLMETIKSKEQLLKGKRALWLENNPKPSPRRDAMLALQNDYDPSSSPSINRSSRPGSNSALGSPTSLRSFQSSYGQPSQMGSPTGPTSQTLRLRGNISRDLAPASSQYHTLPTGRAQPDPEPRGYYEPGPGAEYGDDDRPSDRPKFNMYDTFRQGEGPDADTAVQEYQAALAKLFGMIEGWVRSYTIIPNHVMDQQIARSNQQVWSFLTSCTSPYREQEAYTHVVALLKGSSTRFWLVMRMMVQYCVNGILGIEAWRRYNDLVGEAIDENKEKLRQGSKSSQFVNLVLNANSLNRFVR
jgi:hypothetical protein